MSGVAGRHSVYVPGHRGVRCIGNGCGKHLTLSKLCRRGGRSYADAHLRRNAWTRRSAMPPAADDAERERQQCCAQLREAFQAWFDNMHLRGPFRAWMWIMETAPLSCVGSLGPKKQYSCTQHVHANSDFAVASCTEVRVLGLRQFMSPVHVKIGTKVSTQDHSHGPRSWFQELMPCQKVRYVYVLVLPYLRSWLGKGERPDCCG